MNITKMTPPTCLKTQLQYTAQTLLVLQPTFLSPVDNSVYILIVAYLQTLEWHEGNVKGMSREFREV